MKIQELINKAKAAKPLPKFKKEQLCYFVITDLDLDRAEEKTITIQPKSEYDATRIKQAVDYTFHAYPIDDNGNIGASCECKTTFFGCKEDTDIDVLELFRPEQKQETVLFRKEILPVYVGLCTYIGGTYTEDTDADGHKVLIQDGEIYTLSNIQKDIKGVK